MGKYSDWAISHGPKEGCRCGLGNFYDGQIAQVGGGWGYFCDAKGRPLPHIVDLSGTECLRWSRVGPESLKAPPVLKGCVNQTSIPRASKEGTGQTSLRLQRCPLPHQSPTLWSFYAAECSEWSHSAVEKYTKYLHVRSLGPVHKHQSPTALFAPSSGALSPGQVIPHSRASQSLHAKHLRASGLALCLPFPQPTVLSLSARLVCSRS